MALRDALVDPMNWGVVGTPWNATDGLYQTEWMAWSWDATNPRGTMWLDLGAPFWVTGYYAVLKAQPGGYHESFKGHEFLASDGTQVKPVYLATTADFTQLEHSLKWDNLVNPEKIDNVTPRVLLFGDTFLPRKGLEERSLQVEIYDLGGRLAGRAAGPPMAQAGILEYLWDGRDLAGERVPPGVYLCRIKVEADQRDDLYVRVIHVVY